MSTDQYKFLKLVTDLVVLGLAVLMVSGFGFIALYYMTEPSLTMNPKMWGKISIVLVLTLNGLAMHEFILPLFAKNLNRPLFSVSGILRRKFYLFACGGISFTAWYSAMILGIWKQANTMFSAQQIFLGYLVLATLAVLSTPVLAKVVIAIAERFGSDRREKRNEMVTVVTVDFPHFENLRQQIGYEAAEDTNHELSSCLRQQLRDNDRVCAIGSGRFLVVLPATDAISSQPVTQRLSLALEQLGLGSPFILRTATTCGAAPEKLVEHVRETEVEYEPLRLAA